MVETNDTRNGLVLTEDEFKKMKIKNQLVILYRNSLDIREHLLKMDGKSKWLQWQVAGALVLLTGVIGVLLQHIGK